MEGLSRLAGNFPAIEVSRIVDTLRFERYDGERGLVEQRIDRHKLLLGIAGIEPHHGSKVCKTELKDAGRDVRAGISRAGAGFDVDVQAFGLEVTLAHRHEEWRMRTLQRPIEDHLYVGALDPIGSRSIGRSRKTVCYSQKRADYNRRQYTC